MQRVVKRAQIRIDFFFEVARQKAEPLARFDGGARQDDAIDLAGDQMIHRHRDGKIRLAGTRRADAEDEFVVLQRLQIGALRRRARGDAPLARGDGQRIGVE